jgi:hypothetical protein
VRKRLCGERWRDSERISHAEEQRDFSLRRPTFLQEQKVKKKSACSVRNDGLGRGRLLVGCGREYCVDTMACGDIVLGEVVERRMATRTGDVRESGGRVKVRGWL